MRFCHIEQGKSDLYLYESIMGGYTFVTPVAGGEEIKLRSETVPTIEDAIEKLESMWTIQGDLNVPMNLLIIPYSAIKSLHARRRHGETTGWRHLPPGSITSIDLWKAMRT